MDCIESNHGIRTPSRQTTHRRGDKELSSRPLVLEKLPRKELGLWSNVAEGVGFNEDPGFVETLEFETKGRSRSL